MTKHFFNIERTDGSAVVEIFKIEMIDGLPRAGELVTVYETSSVGATKSARKTIKQLECAQ